MQYQPHANAHDRKLNPALYFVRLFMNLLLAGTLTFFVIHTILWLIRSRYNQIKKKSTRWRERCLIWSKRQQQHDRRRLREAFFMRFTREQRYMHAVLFTTFLGLAGTGLPLRFSESIWARGLAKGVGGFGAILFFHKFFAVVLTIAFLIHVKEIFQRGIMHREKGVFWGPNSMVANWKDVKDLFGAPALVCGTGHRSRSSIATPTGRSSITGRCSGA